MKQEYKYTDTTILSLQDVSLKFGEKTILRDINIEIKDIVRPNEKTAQIISILGKSGIGKSQLFKIIAGLNKPTTGNVLYHGKPVNSGDIGVVAQNYPLFMNKTVLKNLELSASKHPTMTPAQQKEKIDYYLDKLGLTDKKDFYPCSLSGGQRQRIAIIQQVLCSEHFLLLDEPFSGLDVSMVHEVSKIILDIANQDDLNTVIIVSHDFVSSSAISTNLWLMGYDYNPDGTHIEGAKIKYVEDLMEKGFSWNYPDVLDSNEFAVYSKEVRQIFAKL